MVSAPLAAGARERGGVKDKVRALTRGSEDGVCSPGLEVRAEVREKVEGPCPAGSSDGSHMASRCVSYTFDWPFAFSTPHSLLEPQKG